MKIKRRQIAFVVAGMAVAAPVAQGVEGSLYPVAPGAPVATVPWSATPSAQPGVWEVGVPAGGVTDGTKVSIPFACPVEGSEIETVQYERLRVAAPSSFGANVVANGATISRDPDINWPQAQGTLRRIGVGGGACDVSLNLVQSETRDQHKRTWFVGGLTAFARDTTAPEVTITGLPEVVGPGAEAVSLRYTVSDNFGDDGVGDHRIEVDNQVVAGGSGTGEFTVPISTQGLSERDHTIRIVAEGDGTPAGTAIKQFGIDRTGPAVIITTSRLGAKRVRLNLRGADDLADWDLRVSTYISAQRIGTAALASAAAGLPVVARGTGGGSFIVNLPRVRNGELVRLVLYARDAAGNQSAHRAPFVFTGGRQTTRITTNSPGIQGTRRQLEAGLGSRINAKIGDRVPIGGRLRLLPSGEPLPLTTVQLRDPRGRRVAVDRTDVRGRYRFAFRPKVSGTYRVLMEGESDPIRQLRVLIRPTLGAVLAPASRLQISPGKRLLRIPGALRAGNQSADARVFLQQRVGKRWRTVARDFTNGSGRFNLRYRPSVDQDRTLRMRVRVGPDPARAYSATTTKPFIVTVSKG